MGWKYHDWDGIMERPPLLEDVFEKYPKTYINMEIKTPSEEMDKMVDEIVKKYNRTDLTVIIYFIFIHFILYLKFNKKMWGCHKLDHAKLMKKLNPDCL